MLTVIENIQSFKSTVQPDKLPNAKQAVPMANAPAQFGRVRKVGD
jgi:hypothetical protein